MDNTKPRGFVMMDWNSQNLASIGHLEDEATTELQVVPLSYFVDVVTGRS